jgi:hypothetical protein
MGYVADAAEKADNGVERPAKVERPEHGIDD